MNTTEDNEIITYNPYLKMLETLFYTAYKDAYKQGYEKGFKDSKTTNVEVKENNKVNDDMKEGNI